MRLSAAAAALVSTLNLTLICYLSIHSPSDSKMTKERGSDTYLFIALYINPIVEGHSSYFFPSALDYLTWEPGRFSTRECAHETDSGEFLVEELRGRGYYL